MFEIIIILIIIFAFKQNSNTNTLSKLYKILNNQQYANVKTLLKTNTLHLITADNNGENFLFALKNSAVQFTVTDITAIYNQAEKAHIHNVILVTPLTNISSSIVRDQIKKYEFKIWTGSKLNALVNTSNKNTNFNAINSNNKITNYSISNANKVPVHSVNIVSKSNQPNISKNETFSDDPIQEDYSFKNSWFRNLFKKPEQL